MPDVNKRRMISTCVADKNLLFPALVAWVLAASAGLGYPSMVMNMMLPIPNSS
ncbi:MAG: hypothetical protein QMB25_04485 [Pseudomonadales bacterium]|jgi:hypothetical protein